MTPADMEEALREVALLEKELGRRRPEIQRQKDYYRGKHALKFASPEYREWFGDNYRGFADNWCAPVVEALTERQKIVGIRPKGARTTDSKLRGFWEESGAAGEAPLAFNTKATTARVFALVWSKDENGTPEVTFEDPSQAIVGYEPGSRRERKAALKLWHGDDDDFATLYTPDAVWKFQRRRFGAELSSLVLSPEVRASLGGWQPRQEKGDDVWPIPNPLGVVPMVELQNRPDLIDEPMSEIDGVISMQDAINALWAFLFTGADFAALPQRVILGAQLPKIPVLDEQGRKIGEKVLGLEDAQVKRILNLESPNAKIGQWDAANLENFTKVIEKAANHIGNQTRTPLYYFASSIQNISGDTLKALETGLVSKAGERMETDDEPVREIHWLIAKVAGDDALAEKVRGGTVLWADHESRSEAQKVDALSKLKDIGFPFEYIAEQYVGGDADELERIMGMYRSQAQDDPLFKLAAKERQLNGAGQPNGPQSGTAPAAKPPANQQPNGKAA